MLISAVISAPTSAWVGLTCLTSFFVDRSLASISKSSASIIDDLPISLAPLTTTTP